MRYAHPTCLWGDVGWPPTDMWGSVGLRQTAVYPLKHSSATHQSSESISVHFLLAAVFLKWEERFRLFHANEHLGFINGRRPATATTIADPTKKTLDSTPTTDCRIVLCFSWIGAGIASGVGTVRIACELSTYFLRYSRIDMSRRAMRRCRSALAFLSWSVLALSISCSMRWIFTVQSNAARL